LVVSTRVGGVPEVLPKDMIIFAEPEENGKIITKHFFLLQIKKISVNKIFFYIFNINHINYLIIFLMFVFCILIYIYNVL